MTITELYQIEAPSDLPEGYIFEATRVDGSTVSVFIVVVVVVVVIVLRFKTWRKQSPSLSF